MFDPIEIARAAEMAAKIVEEQGGGGGGLPHIKIQLSSPIDDSGMYYTLLPESSSLLTEAAEKNLPIIAEFDLTAILEVRYVVIMGLVVGADTPDFYDYQAVVEASADGTIGFRLSGPQTIYDGMWTFRIEII